MLGLNRTKIVVALVLLLMLSTSAVFASSDADNQISRADFLTIVLSTTEEAEIPTPKIVEVWKSKQLLESSVVVHNSYGVLNYAFQRGYVKQGEMALTSTSLDKGIKEAEMIRIASRLSLSSSERADVAELIGLVAEFNSSTVEEISSYMNYLTITATNRDNLMAGTDYVKRAVDYMSYYKKLHKADNLEGLEATTIEALKTVAIVKSGDKFNFSTSYPALSSGYEWVYNLHSDGFSKTDVATAGSQSIEIEGLTQKRVNDLVGVSYSLSVKQKGSDAPKISYMITTGAQGRVYRIVAKDSAKTELITFNHSQFWSLEPEFRSVWDLVCSTETGTGTSTDTGTDTDTGTGDGEEESTGALTLGDLRNYHRAAIASTALYESSGKYYIKMDLEALPKGYDWAPLISFGRPASVGYGSSAYEAVEVVGARHKYELDGVTEADITAGSNLSIKWYINSDEANVPILNSIIRSTDQNKIFEFRGRADNSVVPTNTSPVFDNWK